MYEAFYGFKQRPFSLNPDPDFLYLSKKHRTALSLLEYSLLNQAAFSVITGEIGTGKTTLIRYLLHHMEDNFSVGLITNTHANFGELLQWALMAFGLEYREKGKVELYQLLYDYLIQEYAQNRQVLLIIDEAQNLGSEALEELRMLSNINVDDNQLLQMLLVGQPALRGLLKQPELEQFAQRIAVDYHLESLDQKEVYEYIYHRIEVAGGEPVEIFDWDACGAIYLYSQGIPRLINLLLDTVLVYGFAEQQQQISTELIQKVVQDKQQGGVFPLRAQDVNIQEAKANGQLDNKVPWPPEPKMLTALDDFGKSSNEKAVIETTLEEIGYSISKDEWLDSLEDEREEELPSEGMFRKRDFTSGQTRKPEESDYSEREGHRIFPDSAFSRKISKGVAPKVGLVATGVLLSIGVLGVFFPQNTHNSAFKQHAKEEITTPNTDSVLAEVEEKPGVDTKRTSNDMFVESTARLTTQEESTQAPLNSSVASAAPRSMPESSLDRGSKANETLYMDRAVASASEQKPGKRSSGDKSGAAETDESQNNREAMVLSENFSKDENEITPKPERKTAKERQVRQVVVQEGDSLSKIIIDAYGKFNEDLLRRVLQLNPQIADSNVLFVGQTIKLPEPSNHRITGRRARRNWTG